MTYHLLDHVNRLNAAELAKPRDARTNMTPGWAPPSEVVFATKPVDGFVRANMARPFPRTHSLGRGDKIRCGMPLLPGQHIHTRQLDSKRYNVVRPFNEAWDAPQLPIQLPLDFSTGSKYACVDRPNHGHGARCGCVFALKTSELGLVNSRLKPPTATVVSTGQQVAVASTAGFFVNVRPVDCPECAGTGRVICDDDRAGRVSPSHKAGGYAEWQRRNQFAGHGTFQVPPELAHIYATDGEPETTERE